MKHPSLSIALLLLTCACGHPPGSVPQSATAATVDSTPGTPATDDQAPYVLPDLPAEAPGTQALAAHGSGYSGGSLLHLALVAASGRVLTTREVTVDANGTFDTRFEAALALGEAYQLAIYIDTNGNGFCNAAPVDQSWRVSVPTVTGDAQVEAPFDTTTNANNTNTTVCEAFGTYDLSFSGLAFQLHEGITLYVDVTDRADGTRVGEVQHQVIAGGRANYGWRSLLLAGHSYILAYFSDVNHNQTCDPLPVDHQWVQVLAAVGANVVATGTHADAQQPACTDMPTGPL